MPLALLAAFLPADLIDFVFELLSEPFGVWDKLRPVDFISRNQLELFFDGGPDLASRIPESFKWLARFIIFEPVIKAFQSALDISDAVR